MGDAVHIAAGLSERDAGKEAADGVGALIDAAIAEGGIVPLAEGDEDVAVSAVEEEVGGKDSNNGEGGAVEIDGVTEDLGRSAEAAVPEAVTEESDGSCAEAIVIEVEVAAPGGMDFEGRKELRGDHEAIHAQGGAVAGEVVILVAIHGHGGESFVPGLPVEEVEIADGSLRLSAVALVDGDQLAGLRVGERIEEHAVDYGEKGCVGADADGEGDDSDEGKGWRLEEHAEGKANVLEESGHGWGGPRGNSGIFAL